MGITKLHFVFELIFFWLCLALLKSDGLGDTRTRPTTAPSAQETHGRYWNTETEFFYLMNSKEHPQSETNVESPARHRGPTGRWGLLASLVVHLYRAPFVRICRRHFTNRRPQNTACLRAISICTVCVWNLVLVCSNAFSFPCYLISTSNEPVTLFRWTSKWPDFQNEVVLEDMSSLSTVSPFEKDQTLKASFVRGCDFRWCFTIAQDVNLGTIASRLRIRCEHTAQGLTWIFLVSFSHQANKRVDFMPLREKKKRKKLNTWSDTISIPYIYKKTKHFQYRNSFALVHHQTFSKRC